MHFGNPQILWLLLGWPLLALLGMAAMAWRRRVEAKLGEPSLLGRLQPGGAIGWRRRRLALLLGAALLLIVAAARPQYGRVEETVRSVGVNVIVAIDCSASMRARDVEEGGGAKSGQSQGQTGARQESRMEWAKLNLKRLVQRLQGNRVGIESFAGDAFLQCPLTLDHDLAGIILDSIDTSTVGKQGTDFGKAIDVANKAFDQGGDAGGARVLVVISDGEDNEGKGLETARKAAKDNGLVVYAIGIGSDRGAPIPDEKGAFMEDAKGAKVNSQLHMETLAAIAQATGGEALRANNSPTAIAEHIAQKIEVQHKAEMESRTHVRYMERYAWFLVPAMLLMLAGLMVAPNRD